MTNSAPPAISIRDLRVELLSGMDVVDEVSFDVGEGEVLALVGESGCGKTATALACLGYARPGTKIAAGEVLVDGINLHGLPSPQLRRLRGSRVSYVPQDPSTALNPGFRIGDQVEEMLRVHRPNEQNLERRAAELFEAVELSGDTVFRRRYPHELSGGQQQRVVIAMAIACEPRLIVLDEPTTGLDVTTQARVLKVIDELRSTHHLSVLYVTHDLAVVAQLADRVAVMYSGRLVEAATREELFAHPRHPYTRRLLAAIPGTLDRRLRLKGIAGTAPPPGERPHGCSFAPRCEFATDISRQEFPPVEEIAPGHLVRCHNWKGVAKLYQTPVSAEAVTYDEAAGKTPVLAVSKLVASYSSRGLRPAETIRVLDGVSFDLGRKETLAVVGESGSGKTTLARCIVGLHQATSGAIALNGVPVPGRAIERYKEVRRRIQVVFQNPDGSLNPRQTVARMIERPLELFFDPPRSEIRAKTLELLELVRLTPGVLQRYPRDLSGGEKQRVAIACALAPRPEIVVCDEITSALDVSVQAAILELLLDLRERLQTSFLFISHDLSVVRAVADRVLVLQQGTVREYGDADAVFRRPKDAYTRALLEAVPEIPEAREDAQTAG
jgi:peptide/nickel transport system ATP-binding protein